MELFGFALVPDLVFYLSINPDVLLHRAFSKYGCLDYWESGMDLYLSSDMFESFKKYHTLLKREYEEMVKNFNFIVIDAERDPNEIQKDIRERISVFLDSQAL